jgi:hypothetical protein
MPLLFRMISVWLCASVVPLLAADQPEDLHPGVLTPRKIFEGLDWKTEGRGDIGGIAEIIIPAGYRFIGPEGTVKALQLKTNLINGNELGYIAPIDDSWYALFQFDPCGYVKDGEKDHLNTDEILADLRDQQEAANRDLRRRNLDTLEILGWQNPPSYQTGTNNLEWAVRLRTSDGVEVVNHYTKLLGRRGVMDVVLVCDEERMPAVVPMYRKLLEGCSFKSDEAYAAYQNGDKVSHIGLSGLILKGDNPAGDPPNWFDRWVFPILGLILVSIPFVKRYLDARKRTDDRA